MKCGIKYENYNINLFFSYYMIYFIIANNHSFPNYAKQRFDYITMYTLLFIKIGDKDFVLD